jgi:hypothetical protein
MEATTLEIGLGISACTKRADPYTTTATLNNSALTVAVVTVVTLTNMNMPTVSSGSPVFVNEPLQHWRN